MKGFTIFDLVEKTGVCKDTLRGWMYRGFFSEGDVLCGRRKFWSEEAFLDAAKKVQEIKELKGMK